MIWRSFLAAVVALLFSLALVQDLRAQELPAPDIESQDGMDLSGLEKLEGFINLYWDEAAGRILLEVEHLDDAFIYVESLSRGIGSNDIGLDRGQLGDTKVVRFVKSGPKILLVEDNLAYRAMTEDEDEQRAVAESFARSVIWGFEDIDPSAGKIIIDATSFIVRDAHGLSARLNRAGEGSYQVDMSRSAVFLPRTKAFPDNTEAEAILTLTGTPAGRQLGTVTPDARAVTVHIHHSFIRLPDDEYEPLIFDPRSGVIGMGGRGGGFADYATAVGDDISVNYGFRHRLKKKDPLAEQSEAIEPIVYYLDRGTPEPIRSALLDGARWWNQAFEAAGYIDAFQVEMMPEDVDPMDVRYNVIQWVHRSTRGWSYGGFIADPRTGEILKGHVTLGSLRVRQDYLIAEGLLAPYVDDSIPPEMLEMALARIRQLSAHEVGHTIGFQHNMAASTQDRASVMDYPAPLVRIREDDTFDLSEAYDDKIGSWDERSVIFAYQDFADDVDESTARQQIMAETIAAGYRFVSDSDSRSIATAHPHGNLWDNGADAIAELEHLMRVREIALQRFSEQNIRMGRSLASLEEVLVPLYLLHRFQIKAVGKLIGGQYFTYSLRGDGQTAPRPVAEARQREAIKSLIATLDPEFLKLPDTLAAMIPPRLPDNPKSRETFTGATGIAFDATAPAASAAELTLRILLEPTRAARLEQTGTPGLVAVTDALLYATWYEDAEPGMSGAIKRQTDIQVLYALLGLAFNPGADSGVRAIALDAVQSLDAWLLRQSPRESLLRAHYGFARFEIERLRRDPSELQQVTPVKVPPGSPIGSFQTGIHQAVN